MENIRLLATDLDGTLIGSADEFPMYSEFRERLARMKREKGTAWAVVTGRTFRSFKEFFSPMKVMGLTPDVIIVRHAYIYTMGRYHYRPHILWNLRILLLLWIDRIHSRQAISEWHSVITRVSHGVRTVRRKRDRLWLRFNTEEAAAFAAEELKKRVDEFHHFRVFHYRKEVDVRSVPFTKGMSLSEMARHMGIDRDEILAIGNGHNDISALDGSVAKFTGCPANSEAEVMSAVHESGGHIAENPSLKGVVEIIDSTLSGTMCSDLPVWWEDPATTDNPSHNRNAHHSGQKRKKRMKSAMLAAVVAATVLIVFASFNAMPGSGLIMKPVSKVLSVFEKVVVRTYEIWGNAK